MDGVAGAVNPAGTGTKVAALHKLALEPGASARVRVRLTAASARAAKPLGAGFDRVLEARRTEADEFYATVIDASLGADAANVMRQALAGMLWGKQYYEYDVHAWLREHGVNPWSEAGRGRRGCATRPGSTSTPGDVISMPDKWEYPWFAAWDLALQTVPLALVDVDFAKGQMELLLKRPLSAPQRPDPGLRVELQRRQPAAARLVGAAAVRARARDPRRGRPRVPQARLRAAADELHLVGQPQGP